MKRISKIFVMCTVLVFIPILLGAIVHDNVTYTDTTVIWHPGSNPHIVEGRVTVNGDAWLIIQDSCIVQFDNGAYLSTYGRLSAIGTSDNGITFTRRDSTDEWYGIYFHADALGSLHYCTIEYATHYTAYGIYADGYFPSIEHCTIQYNDHGIYVLDATSPTLSVQNTIQNNLIHGLQFRNCINPSVSNQIITGHASADGAMYMNDTGEFHIGTGNSITGNTWGLTMDIGSYPSESSYGNIPTTGNTNDDGINVDGGTTSDSVTWYNVDADFIITDNPTIQSDGILTVKDNVTVRFENGKYISVYGTLNGEGTDTDGEGILFTRRHTDDEWYGLYYQTNALGSLKYCTIEYATHYTGYGIHADGSFPSIEHCTIQNNDYGIYATGATSPTLSVNNLIRNNNIEGVHFFNCINPSISNQTITGHTASGGAIYMSNSGEFQIGSGNTVTGNEWGLTINFNSYPSESSYGNIPTTGNTNSDGINVDGGYTSDSVTWYDVDADFIITDNPTIQSDGILTIKDNVTVRFEHGKYITIYGTLNGEGTGSDRGGVLFTRRHSDDQWYGIGFNEGSEGTLEYCTIEHATYYTAAGIHATGSFPSLEHCTIQNNDYGIYATGATSPTLSVNNLIRNNNIEGVHFFNCISPSISNQTITGHTASGGAIYMSNSGEFYIGSGNTVTGNEWGLTINFCSYPSESSYGNIPTTGNTNDDGINVDGGSTSDSIIWYDVDADFILTDNPTVFSDGQLTIKDNVTVRFEHGKYITIYGTLNGEGTSSDGDGVLFTRRDIEDEWSGLYYQTDANGTLQYCTIEYATYYSGHGIHTDGSFPSIEHCTIQYNDYGIYATGATSPTLSVQNTIQNNTILGLQFSNCINPYVSNQIITGHASADGAIYMNDTGEFYIGAGNSITSNTWGLTMDIGSYPSMSSYGNIPTTGNTNDDGINVDGGYTSDSVTWYDVDADFIITDNPTIQSDGILTIKDNVTVRFEHGKYITIYGTLNGEGTDSDRGGILFTRRHTDDGWYGLGYQNGSEGSLEHCTIEYATYYSNARAVYADNPNSLTFDQCILQNNSIGFYGDGACAEFNTHNQIINNTNYGIYLVNACEPTFGSSLSEWNDIYGNGIYDFYNGTSDVTASYVYWGTISSSTIDCKIYDELDSPALGLVTYIPYTNATHDTLYTGDITPPQNVVITTDADSIYMHWDHVENATSYKIYSSDDPYALPPWTFEAEVSDTTWSQLKTGVSKFFYVKALN